MSSRTSPETETLRTALEAAYRELLKHDADYHHRTPVEVTNMIVDALARPRVAPTPGLWRPIETAPKDRTIMLCVEGWEPCSGRWWPVDSCWASFNWEGHFETDKEMTSYVNATSYEPTHWMPLPQGPNSSTDRACK